MRELRWHLLDEQDRVEIQERIPHAMSRTAARGPSKYTACRLARRQACQPLGRLLENIHLGVDVHAAAAQILGQPLPARDGTLDRRHGDLRPLGRRLRLLRGWRRHDNLADAPPTKC